MKKLYRSRKDSVFAGVCGGLGQYLGIDSTLVRIFFVLATIFGKGLAVLIYFAMMIFVPRAPEGAEEVVSTEPFSMNRSAGLLIGGGLIILGFFLALDNLNISWLWWLHADLFWPILLILGGGFFLWRGLQRA